MEHPSKRRRLSEEMASPRDTPPMTDPARQPRENIGDDGLPMIDATLSQLDGEHGDREYPMAHGRSHRHPRLQQKIVEPRDSPETTVVATSTVSFVSAITYNLPGINMWKNQVEE